jgi:hypothetical protein
MEMHKILAEKSIDPKRLGEYFDGLNNEARIAEVGTMTAAEQARLFEAVKGFRPLNLDDYAPSSGKPLQEVIHHGKNSLPLFSRFQKRFCLPDRKTSVDQRWGYNHQPLSLITGPGYFVCKIAEAGEVVVDYFEVPPSKPEAWPPILDNSARLSRFIYYHTRDYLRGVSKNVSIGRATRNGQLMKNWFVLCREGR